MKYNVVYRNTLSGSDLANWRLSCGNGLFRYFGHWDDLPVSEIIADSVRRELQRTHPYLTVFVVRQGAPLGNYYPKGVLKHEI